MKKELRELLAQLDATKLEVRTLLGEDKVAEAETKMLEVRSLEKKIQVQKELDDAEEREQREGRAAGGTKDDQELETQYRSAFLKGLRRRSISSEERSVIEEYNKRAVMHGGDAADQADGDSNLVVPQDIQTRINELMRTLNDLTQYVSLEEVSTRSGKRVLEKDDDMTPLPVVDEYGQINETDNPKFVGVLYQLLKRAGVLPLTNELLADSDQNLIRYVTKWIGKKVVVTRNTLVTTLLATMDKTDLADVDAIKKVLNVTLDPAISLTAVLLTNQDGYHWLDEQKDAAGRYLLQDDITQPGRKLFKGRPVAVASNRYMPSVVGVTTKAPLIIGNLKELVVFFTRGKFELASTKVGGNAWRRDTTELRVITRDDCRMWDGGAATYGQLTIG